MDMNPSSDHLSKQNNEFSISFGQLQLDPALEASSRSKMKKESAIDFAMDVALELNVLKV